MGRSLRNILLALVLALAALALALEVAARAQARRLVAALSPVATLEYAGAGIDWNGRLRLDAPRLAFHQGPWPGVARARVAHFKGGGRLWTLARFLSGAKGLPLNGSIAMHGLVLSSVPGYAAVGAWLRPPGMVLFEMLGCEGAALTAADHQRMRIYGGERVDRIDYRTDTQGGNLELEFAFEQPALSILKGSARFTAFNPSLWNDARAQAQLRLAHAELDYDDPGYLVRRNAYCAERNGVSVDRFVEQHITAVDDALAAQGIAPGESVRTLYRNLVGNGGSLRLTILPDADWKPVGFAAYSRADMLRLLNVTARHDDAPPVMLQLAFNAPMVDPDAGASTRGDAAIATSAQTESSPPPGVRDEPPVQAAVDPLPATVAQPAAAPPIDAPPVAAPVATGPVAPDDETIPAAPSDLGPSAPPPPKDSTLALVWKPGVVERLAPRAASVRDYEPVAVASLGQYTGRRIRLLTQGGKLVDGELRRIEAGQAKLMVRVAGGSAEIGVPLANVREARLVLANPR